MKHSIKTGLGFGITSGVITTLGLMVGLYSGTNSVLAVIGGILTIAVADAFSDSLGMHVSKEFEDKATKKEIWESTLTTFFSKFFISITFVFPILVLSLKIAIVASIVWGFCLLGFFSFFIAREKNIKPVPVVMEHIFTATVVVLITKLAGDLIGKTFV